MRRGESNGQERKGLPRALWAGRVKRLEPGRNVAEAGARWGGPGCGRKSPGLLQIHAVQVTVDGAVGALTILSQGDHITHHSSGRHDVEGEEGAVSGN